MTDPDRFDGQVDALRRDLEDAGVTPDVVRRAIRDREDARSIAKNAIATTHGPRARRRRSPWGRVAVVGLAAAALVFAFVLFDLPGQRATITPPAAATPPLLPINGMSAEGIPESGEPAAPHLERLAELAAEQPPGRAGPVQHVRTVGWGATNAEQPFPEDEPVGVLIPQITDTYFLPDGRFRTTEQFGAPLDQDGRPTDKIGHWTYDDPASDYVLSRRQPGPDYAKGLPTDDPAALAGALMGPVPCVEYIGGCLLEEVESLYGAYVLAPDVRSALWLALAEEPSITYLGRTQDRLGRDAEVFTALSYRGNHQILAFADPKTGAWLGSELILIRPLPGVAFDPPAVIEFTSIELSLREANRPEHTEVPTVIEVD